MEYTFLLQETVKFWWGVMFLFFDCFQLQNVILFLFFKKHFYLLKAKITTLFVLIFALSRKKSICARKLVQNLRWKRQCGKFNTRENLFFLVKNKGKFFFSKSAIPMQIYTPMYRRSHGFASSTTKTQNKKNKKTMLFSAFLILFSLK